MSLVLAGLLVGGVVGLTGMGGGALMTPVLVFFFGVPPLAAVSSDVVASFFMKPVGAVVHLRRGTVNMRLVGWLCLGSVPAAFGGVLLLRALGDGQSLQAGVKRALGVALLVASVSIVVKAYLTLRQRVRAQRRGDRSRDIEPSTRMPHVRVRPVPTVLVGVLGGLVVGMTSVGSGSLIIISLLLLYPALQASQLVGTDLTQAVPLVGAASLGHLLFGDFQMSVTTALVLGAIPGVWLGAHASAHAHGGLVRRALAVVLMASGLKLVGASTPVVAVGIALAMVLGPLASMVLRVRNGEPARLPARKTPERVSR